MNLDDIKKLIAAIENSKLVKLTVKKNGEEVCLEKEKNPFGVGPPITTCQTAPTPIVKNNPVIEEANQEFIRAPLVGTFYVAPSPEAPPFVKVGDTVTEHTIVCIVEAMKVLNEVKAGTPGRVTKVLVENGQPVEYGTKLFAIE